MQIKYFYIADYKCSVIRKLCLFDKADHSAEIKVKQTLGRSALQKGVLGLEIIEIIGEITSRIV